MSPPEGSSPSTPDFGPLAADYDRLRPADANWCELADVLVQEGGLLGRRVLDVGCGTGRLAAELATRGARVWGVDPSEEMLAVARKTAGRSAGFKAGTAESLPFKDSWFERALMRLVAHLVERPRAFAELARVLVPNGRAVIATFDPSHFAAFWLNGIFPSIETIDRRRFPEPRELTRELGAAGFAQTTVRTHVQRDELSREAALERIRGRYISTLRLLSEDEYAEGLARAEAELPERIPVELHWNIVSAVRP